MTSQRLGRVIEGTAREEVLQRLLASWTEADERLRVHRRIDEEIRRFNDAQGASLPFRTRNKVAWVTMAPSPADLRREIELLRAWVIPSFGWEDRTEPFIAPGQTTNGLAPALFAVSPAGYFRWWCTDADFAEVADRLARMRALALKRPGHVLERVPSLLELRQQFRTALVTGEREAAEAAIRAIDHYQLDSAINTHLMWVRLLDQFGDYAAILDHPSVERLLALRLPHAVRSGILRAYHARFIAPFEPDSRAAAEAYQAAVHHHVGGLLTLAVPEDGPEIARSLAYRAWATADAAEATRLLNTADPLVVPLLRSILADQPFPAASRDAIEAFKDALRRGDLRTLQALASSVLAGLGTPGAHGGLGDSLAAIRDSLEVLPNPALASELASVVEAPTAGTVMPQSWSELLVRLRERDLAAAERFLSLDSGDRPTPDSIPPEERAALLASLEELLTDPAYASSPGGWVADTALPALTEDFVSDRGFPRAELAPVYLQLLRLWADHKRGSAYAPDGHMLLLLATAVLRHPIEDEGEVASCLIDWWHARPVRAALPFLLEALEIVLDFTAADGPAQQLWFEGARLAGRDSVALSVSERGMWRRLGLRAGLDAQAVTEIMPEAGPEPDRAEPDVLRELGVSKIAIVSLHRRPAEEARDILAERTGATVFVVDETVPGPDTRNAQTADAVLFVWAATKHAVFRAFDAVRDRIVYVPGTGANSIVVALERWAIQRQEKALT